jgi:hypothetical protein
MDDDEYKIQFRVVLSSEIVLLVTYKFKSYDYKTALSLGEYRLAKTLSNLGYDGVQKKIRRVTLIGEESW